MTIAVRPSSAARPSLDRPSASTNARGRRRAARAREADEVAEERRVRPLAALVRRDARELEQLVDLRLREVEAAASRPASAASRRASSSHPSMAAALDSARHEGRRPQGDRRRGAAGRPRARHGPAALGTASACSSSRAPARRPAFLDDAYEGAGARIARRRALRRGRPRLQGAAALRRGGREAPRRPDAHRAAPAARQRRARAGARRRAA